MKDDPTIHICVVRTPEGEKHYLTLVPLDVAFSKGLIPESIIGALLRPLEPGEAIRPEVFARNSVFVKFMHEVIARDAPLTQQCQAEAKRAGSGWVYIIDQRIKTPQDAVPPEDIVGGLQAKDGVILPGSYAANPNHMLLTENGFFKLGAGLHQCLLTEIGSRMRPKP